MNWVSRSGERLKDVAGPERFGSVHLGPDGNSVAVSRTDAGGNEDIWLIDFDRTVMKRLTFDAGHDFTPAWSPDGRQVAFSSDRTGVAQIYRKDSSGVPQEVHRPQRRGPDEADQESDVDGKARVRERAQRRADCVDRERQAIRGASARSGVYHLHRCRAGILHIGSAD